LASDSARGSGVAARVREVVLVVLAFLLAGAACGWLWHAWWAPAPTGVVIEGQVFFPPDEAFSGTALYMLVAAGAGALLGVVLSLVFERDELWTLAAVVVGAVAAGVVMAQVGHLLGPEDVDRVAARTENFEEVPSDLRAGPLAAYAAFPGGALVGFVVVLVTFTRRGFTGRSGGVGSAPPRTEDQ
jgi:hypothetical protein